MFPARTGVSCGCSLNRSEPCASSNDASVAIHLDHADLRDWQHLMPTRLTGAAQRGKFQTQAWSRSSRWS
jgi:hypothetical protein